ncbi:MFS transporter [Herbiconiux sp. P17]|uniref:MFS transporter n=1 Tax=Herbiconiux wuyangfengii TaxID=3342794 RepID=UPI0035B7C1FD
MSVLEESTAALSVVGPARRRASFRLSPTAAFIGTAIGFAALYLAAGAPTPLFLLLEEQWAFPAWELTIAFAIYAIALLAALLVGGSLSDHLGRRPVLIGALALETAAMVLFVFAPDVGWVILARAVQGLATGIATSAFTASVVELAPERFRKFGAVVGSVAPAGGLALGALITGFAVQFTLAPAAIVFGALAVIMVLALLVVVFSRETNPGRPGAARSLIPRIAIPRPARIEFVASIPVQLASWMLAGLFMGLVPSIIRDVFHIDSGALNGITTFVEPAAAAIAALLLGSLVARRAVVYGMAAVLVGTGVIVLGVAAGVLPLLFVGGVIGGIGFGASFSGSLRALAPLAAPESRAELFAGVFLVAYLAFGVPTIIAGQLIAPLGLLGAVLLYGAAILVAAIVGLAAQLRLAHRNRR